MDDLCRRRISVRDMDSRNDIPVVDPGSWKLIRHLFDTAIVENGTGSEFRVAIYQLRAAGIWRAEWDRDPDLLDDKDLRGIINNEDRTR